VLMKQSTDQLRRRGNGGSVDDFACDGVRIWTEVFEIRRRYCRWARWGAGIAV